MGRPRTPAQKVAQKARTEKNKLKPIKVKKFRTLEQRLEKKRLNKLAKEKNK